MNNDYRNYFFQKTKRTLLFSAFCFTSALCAQTVATPKIKGEIKIINNHQANKVNITFQSEKEIYNLLVLITDSLGQTIFLDNRYRFKGDYNHNVDFKEYKKGEYTVKIIGDEEKFTKKIDVR
jgi:hypothetical protein